MTRLLRHDRTVPREEVGAVDFRILAPMFHSKFTSFPCWSIRTWLNYLQIGGGAEKRIQYCVDPYSADTILYLRAFQGHSGGKHINLTLQDNVLLPSDFAEHKNHVRSFYDMHSIMQSGLIPGGKDVKKGRHAVFFTAVNPMFIDHFRERDYDVTKPRIAVYKHNWKIHQNTMRVAQSKGLQFYQTRSKAIILYNTFTCGAHRESGDQEVTQEKTCTAKRISLLLYRKKKC